MAAGSLHFVFVFGCTGCGKGAVGRELADRLNAEIISVDSMKVYRRMDIGTAKPGPEARAAVPHHLIDVVEPHEEFSVATFVASAENRAAEIAGRGRTILAVGGTALYIKALSEGLFDGPSADPDVRRRLRERIESDGLESLHAALERIDPAAAGRIHRNDERRIVRALEVYELTRQPITALQTQWDRRRTKHRCSFVGVRRAREDQNHRTNMRVHRLIERGWIDEVASLLHDPQPLSTSARQALGYGELIDHLAGHLSLEEAVEKIKISTRRFAKAQRTWFKRFRDAVWFDIASDEDAATTAGRVLDRVER